MFKKAILFMLAQPDLSHVGHENTFYALFGPAP